MAQEESAKWMHTKLKPVETLCFVGEGIIPTLRPFPFLPLPQIFCDGTVGTSEGTAWLTVLFLWWTSPPLRFQYPNTVLFVSSVILTLMQIKGRDSRGWKCTAWKGRVLWAWWWVGSALVVHCSCGFCAVWSVPPSEPAWGRDLSLWWLWLIFARSTFLCFLGLPGK